MLLSSGVSHVLVWSGFLSLALTSLLDRLGLDLYASLGVFLMNLFRIGSSVETDVQ